MATAGPMGTRIEMTDIAALYRLLSWLSPSYPVGAYSYSHGIEQAVAAGHIHDAATAEGWIADIVAHGAGRADGVLLAAAWRAATDEDRDRLTETARFAAAFVATEELHLETMAQGAAFLKITREAWPAPPILWLAEAEGGRVALPVAIGAAAAGHGIALEAVLPATIHAFAANLVSAAIRLVPLGQTDGQRITARLEPIVARAATEAAATPLDEIATATLMVDMSSMHHETQYTRLFRS